MHNCVCGGIGRFLGERVLVESIDPGGAHECSLANAKPRRRIRGHMDLALREILDIADESWVVRGWVQLHRYHGCATLARNLSVLERGFVVDAMVHNEARTLVSHDTHKTLGNQIRQATTNLPAFSQKH